MWFVVGNGTQWVTKGPTGKSFAVVVGNDVRHAWLYEFEDLYTKELLRYSPYRKFYMFDDFVIDEKIFERIFNSSTTATENEIEGVLDAFDIVDFDKVVLTYLDNTTYSIDVIKNDGTIYHLI